MTPERRNKVKAVLEEALRRPSDERAAFLDEACAADLQLRADVESLVSRGAGPAATGAGGAQGQARPSPRNDLVAPADTYAGRRIGHYELISELGRGGMGNVYLARDERLRRPVALKILPEQYTQSRDRVLRFQQEARTASALNHPNVLTIYEVGEADGLHYIATELITGQTLRERLSGSEGMPLGDVLDVMAQVASALQAAHAAGLVHRDIKPENIMIREDGLVKVVDFGLAKVTDYGLAKLRELLTADSASPTAFRTKPGLLVGTPNYMSPEQIDGSPVDARSDLFALGAVMYECLTARCAFSGQNVAAVWVKIQKEDPEPLSRAGRGRVPPDIERITLKALAKRPAERYQSAAELLEDLRAAQADTKGTRQARATRGGRSGRIRTSRLRVINTAAASLKQARWAVPATLLAVALLAAAQHFVGRWATAHRPPPEALRWYEEGAEALRDGTYYKASKAFEQAISLDGEFAVAHSDYAVSLAELDYTDRAREEIVRAQALAGEQALPLIDELRLRASGALVNGDFPRAVELFRQITESSTAADRARAYVDLGVAHEKNEAPEDALAAYREAVRLDGQYAAALMRLGILYGRQLKVKEAEEALGRAEHYYEVTDNDEGVAEVSYRRGALWNNVGERLEEARAQLQKALTMPRANEYQKIKTLLQLSSLSCSLGDVPRAKEYAREATDRAQLNRMDNLTANGFIERGNACLCGREFDEAEGLLKQAAAFAASFKGYRARARAQLSLGSLYVYRGRVDEGLAQVKEALAFYGRGGYRQEASQALILIGQSSRKKGEYESALDAFGRLLELSEQLGVRANIAHAHRNIGHILLYRGQFPQALEHFAKGVELDRALGDKTNACADLVNSAEALWQMGRYDEALRSLAEADSFASQVGDATKDLKASIHVTRARMKLSQLNGAVAVPEALRALELNGGREREVQARALGVLALAQETRPGGKTEEVRKRLAEALRLAEESGDAGLSSDLLLTAAEVQLGLGDAGAALSFALRAEPALAALGRAEAGWRAWSIAARAAQLMKNDAGAAQYAARGSDMLATLGGQWGEEAFGRYLARPDVAAAKQLIDGNLRGRMSKT